MVACANLATEHIESEDSASPESEDEDGSMSGSRPPGQPKPMTTRQAVLASMVDSSHVALGIYPIFNGTGTRLTWFVFNRGG
jgi:hypothetical protein